jgi:hypothetical protein
MRGRYLLAGLLLFLSSSPFTASAEFKCRSMIGLDVVRPLKHVNLQATRIHQAPFNSCSPGRAESPLLEREWQLCGKHTVPVHARLAEARIEELKRQRAAPPSLKIPTIQLLDCTALAEEEVCKGLMCMWEAGRCHEATSTSAPEVVGPTVRPPQ